MNGTDTTDALLDDPGDLMDDSDDTPDQPAADDPIHLAKCAECSVAVKYRPNVTGTGFFLLDADPDAAFGAGPHGRPVCPNGHGEMAIADDASLTTAAEAFAAVAARQAEAEPVQGRLPGVTIPFNYPGCFKELEDQAVLVQVLEDEHEHDAKVARESKKKLEDARDLLVAMTLKFRDRRRAKEAGVPDPMDVGTSSPRLVKCTWEAQHAGEECPLCDDRSTSPMVLRDVFGNVDALPPADAEAHVDAVNTLIAWIETREIIEALETIDTFVAEDLVAGWTTEARQAVKAYADQQLDLKNDALEPGADRLDRPSVLGTPHIPAAAQHDPENDDAYLPQLCAVCGEVLPRPDAATAYQLTDFIGIDCAGKAPKAKGPDHHYPTRGTKKPAKKKSK